MNTETLTEPTELDTHVAGRPFPQLQPDLSPAQVRSVFQDRRAWWLDVAEQFYEASWSARSLRQVTLATLWLQRSNRAWVASRDYRTVA